MKRSGWISQVGINKPESVADHSFRCAILAMCIGDLLDLDSGKLIRMMLLHDIHEAKTGDFDSQAKRVIGNLEIKKREKDAIQEILSFLPMRLGNKYSLILKELNHQASFEAVLANDIDKIELLIQTLDYKKEGYDANKLKIFWLNIENKIKTPLIQEFLKLLREKYNLTK